MANAESLYTRYQNKVRNTPRVQKTSEHPSRSDNVVTMTTPNTLPQETSPNGQHVAYIGENVEKIPTDLIAQFSKSAKRLDLSYNRVSTLEGLERFTSLEELILDNNQLTDDSFSRLPKLARLTTLTVNKNLISDTEQLLAALSKNTPNLRYLSLLGNQACPNELLGDDHDDKDYQRYRYFVLYTLPGLTFLDSRPVASEERKEAKRVGQFMKVIRPTTEMLVEDTKKRKSEEVQYSPLPQSADVAGQHRGVFGQCKYVYYGKHSEGNRFIRNNQL